MKRLTYTEAKQQGYLIDYHSRPRIAIRGGRFVPHDVVLVIPEETKVLAAFVEWYTIAGHVLTPDMYAIALDAFETGHKIGAEK